MEKNIHCTLTDQELAAKADQWIDELIASGGKSFTMQVPARPNADTDLIFSELNNRFKKLITQQSGPVWVKANTRLPVNDGYYCFKANGGYMGAYLRTASNGSRWFCDSAGGTIRNWKNCEWLDESATPAAPLPTFWDVANAFKWAAEYKSEKGEHLMLADGWCLMSDGGVNEELTPGNVAELYCLQQGFEKEATPAAGREESNAVEDSKLAILEEEVKRRTRLLEENLKLGMRINRPGISEQDQELTWQDYKRRNNL